MGAGAILKRARGILLHPADEFPKVRDEPLRKVLLYWIFFFAIAVLLGLASDLIYLALAGKTGFSLPPISSLQAFYRIFLLLAAISGFLILLLWLHFWVYLLGGRKGMGQTIKAVLYSQTPGFLLLWIPIPEGLARFAFLCLVAAWTLAILLTGIQDLHEVTGTVALASFLCALVGWVVLVFLLDLLLMSSVQPVEVTTFAPQNWFVIP